MAKLKDPATNTRMASLWPVIIAKHEKQSITYIPTYINTRPDFGFSIA
ncbi:hypothetical protein [Fulvivirga kasyanovii]|nr:hypothetical protein [Fulvivirga kasyanovii]